jgi:Putative Ig domain
MHDAPQRVFCGSGRRAAQFQHINGGETAASRLIRTGEIMRLRLLSLTCGLAIYALVTGCSGGGGSNPPTPISITTMTLVQGTINSTYNATLAATGGSGTYTWSVSSGTLPAGLALSTAGVISGTPTAAGLTNFTVQVEDSETSPEMSTQPLKLAVSGGNLTITATPVNGQVGGGYSFDLTATGGVPPYTWAGDTTNPIPPGLTLSSSGTISGTPTTAGKYSVDLSVTDSVNSTVTNNVSITISPSGASLPNGTYAFEFSGTGPNGAVAINGAFLLQGQTVTGGYDENIASTGAQVSQNISDVTVTPGTGGLSQLKFQLAGTSTVTFALATPASIVTAGSGSTVRIIEFDDTTGSGTRGSGFLKVANPSPNASAIVNNYAFSLSGVDSSANPVAIVGSFKADGAGHITGYTADENDNGTAMPVTSFTGTYDVNVLRGTIQFTWNSTTYNFSFYEVAPSELYVISVDKVGSNVPLISGVVEQQTGTLSNASLSGSAVLGMKGLASLSGALAPDITLGVATFNGTGGLTVAYDEYKGQLLSPQSFTGTYSVTAASGRVALTSSGTPAILYLLDTNQAFVLGGDTSASSGFLQPQSGSSFTKASFTGNYLGGSIALDDASVLNEVELAVPDGNGNIAFSYNSSGPKGLASNQTLTGATYSVGSNGRTPVTASDGTTRVFYIVSPTKALLLSGEGGGYLGSLEQ